MEFVTSDLPPSYYEGYKNCTEYNLGSKLRELNIMDRLKYLWKRVEKDTLVGSLLKYRRIEFQRLIEVNIKNGRFQRWIKDFEEIYSKMKDCKGDDTALLHLAFGVIVLLKEAGEINPKKLPNGEEGTLV